MDNPTLIPMRMFKIIVMERGWMFNPGGEIIWDERIGGARPVVPPQRSRHSRWFSSRTVITVR
jgi:hypothetical protein